MAHYILAGDIGGTSSRFQLLLVDSIVEQQTERTLSHPTTVPRSLKSYNNSDYSTFPSILLTYLSSRSVPNMIPTVVVLACAGPVQNNKVVMTASSWKVNGEEIRDLLLEMQANKKEISGESLSELANIKDLGITVKIINDFAAQGYGVLTLPPKSLVPLNPSNPSPTPNGPKLVIGPGTGLGYCYLTSSGEVDDVADPSSDSQSGDYTVQTSEGGHGDFTPRSNFERLLLSNLCARYNAEECGSLGNRTKANRVATERVVSGAGIQNIYEFIRYQPNQKTLSPDADCSIRTSQKIDEKIDASPKGDMAAIIAKHAMRQDPACELAMRTFASSLANEIGSSILRFLPSGGVYISGGVTAKNIGLLKTTKFWEEVCNRGRLQKIVQGVPVFVVDNCEGVGVVGGE